jgi:rubrerythrin
MDKMNFNSIEETLKFAIEKEREAAEFYEEWAEKANNESMKKVLLGFSKEERKHEALIEDVMNGKKFKPVETKITNLKISDYLVDSFPSENMKYQDALMIAMQREKVAFKLYSDLAESTREEEIKNLFLALAQEEAKHKLRLETIYDDIAYPEN